MEKRKRNLLLLILPLLLVLSFLPLIRGVQELSDTSPNGVSAEMYRALGGELTELDDADKEFTIPALSEEKTVVSEEPIAKGILVTLVDSSYGEGLTCVSEEENLYLVENEADLKDIPEEVITATEPNYTLDLLGTEANDTLFTNGAQWNLENMKVPAAWAKGQFGDSVTVAVIDSGLFGVAEGETHEDIDVAKVVKPYNFLDNNENVSDEVSHGTFVSGLIFANTNNGTGIAGIMPNVNLMPLKVSGSNRDAEISLVIKAINYAVENGADVINMSLGTKVYSEALETACNTAVENGVLVVAAAGNDGDSSLRYPAAYDSVVGVGSVTSENLLAATSQYGDGVYVVAPGAGVVSTFNETNQYKRSSGTSFASPGVAALGAMAKSLDSDITQEGFKQLLQDTCVDLGETGRDSLYGYGLVNFEKAANKLLGTDTDTHHWGDWQSDGASTHSRVCTDADCAAKETALHHWDNGVTRGEDMKYTCTDCGAERITTGALSGVWEYELIENDTAVKLTKYIGSQTILVVPSVLEIDGKSVPVTEIGNETFMGTDVFWLEFPDSITKVEDGIPSISGITGACAFCDNLTVVKLSANMDKVADYMFYGAGSDYRLELTVPDGVKEIGMSAFSLCNSITDLSLPESVTKIDNSAFYQARRLKKLDLPGVTTIEADAFTETIFEENYENLWKAGEFEGIAYAGHVAYLYFGPYTGSGTGEYAPSMMPENTEILLKDGTLGISEFCFSNHYVNKKSCENNLKAITVPDSLAYIFDGTFDGYILDMYGFSGSYGEAYAGCYDNITFNGLNTPAAPDCSYDWYDYATGDVYELSSAEDLWGFADIVSIGEDSFAGKTVMLKNDIDLGGVTEYGYTVNANKWFALNGFQGTFDGQGYTVSGMYINSPNQDEEGFFSNLPKTAIIKNLTLEGKIIGRDKVGGIVGASAGATIENCAFNGNIKAGYDYGYVGGIVGYGTGVIADCETDGSMTICLDYVSDTMLNGASGGIIGYMSGPTTVVKGCTNNMDINSNGNSLGGIAGQSMMMAKIENCTNNGIVNGYRQTGGILGRLVVLGNGEAIQGCVNNGNVTGSDDDTGGILGTTSGGNMLVVSCVNTGNVTGKINAGGICAHNSGITVQNSCNSGNITADSFAGGIIGKDSANGVINCYNLGTITAKSWAGGITAYLDNAHGTEGRMTNCYNMGHVTATVSVNNVDPLGSVYLNANIFENCYYLSDAVDTSVENHTGKTKAAFTGGEVAYLLGDAYGQTIGVDAYPVFRNETNQVLVTEDGLYYNDGQTPHEHHYGDWKSDGADTHSKECACGDKVTENHHWDEGEVTKEPTETGEGVKTYCCTVCGETKTEAIAPADPEPTDPEPVEMPFTDVSEGQWFYPDVAFVYERNLFNGVEATLFCPDATMTRGMFVTVLGRLEGIDATQYTEMPFTDVKENLYYAGYIGWAAENGIVKGVTETTFAPDSLVSRQDIAVLLSRYAEFKSIILTEKVPAKTFTDNDKIGAYAGDAVSALQQADILNGYENGSFDPLKSATRAEVAKIFHCFTLDYVK